MVWKGSNIINLKIQSKNAKPEKVFEKYLKSIWNFQILTGKLNANANANTSDSIQMQVQMQIHEISNYQMQMQILPTMHLNALDRKSVV